ncbi:Polyketide synthase PksR [Escovopsis weberi]|uniref:Polyketide synthase PksR n=1 Tax=Escovopsis weberi TaxID=150374 RepID=A0A0M8N3S1_ESCWE|nr:Polyketide synthase PksR [Escovopsis weberi]
MAEQSNPTLIQAGDPSRAPLFLLHDSSGGTFNYYRLEPLGRPVYAIHNPLLGRETKWEGGAMMFVTEYIKLIKSVHPRGDILVGGWSLGGQLGIDIGRVLAQDKRSKLHVLGILMIDTLYPYWGPAGTVHADLPVDLLLGPCPPEMREQILRCTRWTMADSLEWVERNWAARRDALEGIEAMEPAPAVHLFATQYIPVTKGPEGAVAMTDYMRHDKGGWGMFPHEFIVATWELNTHHFGLFEKDMVGHDWDP